MTRSVTSFEDWLSSSVLPTNSLSRTPLEPCVSSAPSPVMLMVTGSPSQSPHCGGRPRRSGPSSPPRWS
eukprot:3496689-Prymnesium_polylepis.2